MNFIPLWRLVSFPTYFSLDVGMREPIQTFFLLLFNEREPILTFLCYEPSISD